MRIRSTIRSLAVACCLVPGIAAAQPPANPAARPQVPPTSPSTPPAPAVAAAHTADPTKKVGCADIRTTGARFMVRFNGDKWEVTNPAETRLTDRDRIEVCVEHFNYLRYSLKFDVAEQKSESYAYLTKLWSSILSPSITGALGVASQTPEARSAAEVDAKLVEHLRNLFNRSRALDQAIAAAGRPYAATGLTDGQAGTLRDVLGDPGGSGLIAQAEALGVAYAALQDFVTGDNLAFGLIYGSRQEMYKAIVAFHDEVAARAAIFVRLATKTIGAEIKKVGKKSAGTRVTFTLVAVDGSGAVTPMEDVTYFLQSNMPLVAHGGLSFSGLNDFTFDKVKRASSFGEDDLFQQQSDTKESTSFTLFLGWQFYGAGDDPAANRREGKIGAALSLGTDVRHPGARVFAGPSVILFNRFVLTAGAVVGKENAPEGTELAPNLFAIISAKPKTSWFFAVSTKVY